MIKKKKKTLVKVTTRSINESMAQCKSYIM